jgi:DNA replication protein
VDFWQDLVQAPLITVSDLVLQHYRAVGMSNRQLIVYLQMLSFAAHGEQFPPVAEIAQRTGLAEDAIYTALHEMLDAGFIDLRSQENAARKRVDWYDLTPLYARLQEKLAQPVAGAVPEDAGAPAQTPLTRQRLFDEIEVEFGRPLSPIEQETISAWLDQDHYAPELVSLALREAVLNQAYSLKYMDRILLNWEKRNIRTKADVERERANRNRF